MRRLQSTSVIVPLLLMLVLFVPWLGEMFFYSKGEPREAIVAVSMLQSGDWILPVSYGGDIPYKPPFLAWLIAIFSVIFNGGEVSEFTSRLPSALAGVALLVATWRVLLNRVSRDRAWLTLFVLATSFEFFRACLACRVDMVLTCCMVGGIYALFTMRGRPLRALWAIILFSGATLTKGPVGTLLPCLAMGIYFLLERHNFFKVFFSLTAIALASFVLPAVWYWLAWKQGGDGFAALAWEENIGRLTGHMGYESHVNPWYYNVTSILAGMLPWSLPVAAALCVRRVRTAIGECFANRWTGLSQFGRLSVVVGLTVFIFYCIPSSKRSVYLLPCYPFLAYGTAWLLGAKRVPRIMHIWSNVLAVIAVVAPVVIIGASLYGWGDPTLDPLRWYQWVIAAVPFVTGLWWLTTRSRRADGMVGTLMLTYVILIAYSGALAPVVMNPRSDYGAAMFIDKEVPAGAPIVTHIAEDSLMRYYSMNFYLGDRLRLAGDTLGETEYLITNSQEQVDSLGGLIITSRSADTRGRVYLVYPWSRARTIASEPLPDGGF